MTIIAHSPIQPSFGCHCGCRLRLLFKFGIFIFETFDFYVWNIVTLKIGLFGIQTEPSRIVIWFLVWSGLSLIWFDLIFGLNPKKIQTEKTYGNLSVWVVLNSNSFSTLRLGKSHSYDKIVYLCFALLYCYT